MTRLFGKNKELEVYLITRKAFLPSLNHWLWRIVKLFEVHTFVIVAAPTVTFCSICSFQIYRSPILHIASLDTHYHDWWYLNVDYACQFRLRYILSSRYVNRDYLAFAVVPWSIAIASISSSPLFFIVIILTVVICNHRSPFHYHPLENVCVVTRMYIQ